MDSERECAFDILSKRNVPHIPEKIFFLLDFESFKTCLNVSDEWNKLLMTDSYQRKAATLYREEALRDAELVLSHKIRGAQTAEWIREVIKFIITTLLIFIGYNIL